MIITEPGYYSDVPMHAYLAGPCPEPEVSSGIIVDLFEDTPAHARSHHPKMGGGVRDLSPRAEKGSAVHSLVLGGYPVEYGIFDNYTTKDAKAFRDNCLDNNTIPMLAKDRLHIEAAAGAARSAIAVLGAGKFEQTMVWKSNGVWCKGRADWLSDGPVSIEGIQAPQGIDLDVKTVERARPTQWEKTNLTNGDLDVQMGNRHAGHLVLSGMARLQVWLLQEIEPPYATAFVVLGQSKLQLALRKHDYATKLWRKCLDEKRFPAYGFTPHVVDAKPWEEERVIAKAGAR